MKKHVTNTNDLLGKKITGVFIDEGQLIIVTDDNFVVFGACGGDWAYIDDDLRKIDLKSRFLSSYPMGRFIESGIITQEEINQFKEEHRLSEIKRHEDYVTAQKVRDLAERDRLNKLYPPG